MEILVTGDASRWEELRSSRDFSTHDVRWEADLEPAAATPDLIIDLSLDERPEHLMLYAMKSTTPVLACLVKTPPDIWTGYGHIFACNWLPGFIGMPVLETAAPANDKRLREIMASLGWQFEIVRPAVGMVTPRVVCMIINEAFYTLADGTASRQDIDISMKLGTNYPYGPFEWSERIGIKNVYEVLEAVYRETGDERYKICPLLQETYLANQ
ncbi:3-hydroxyacyl-CoA dehydrogenase family protein [Chitinophaga lutea]